MVIIQKVKLVFSEQVSNVYGLCEFKPTRIIIFPSAIKVGLNKTLATIAHELVHSFDPRINKPILAILNYEELAKKHPERKKSILQKVKDTMLDLLCYRPKRSHSDSLHIDAYQAANKLNQKHIAKITRLNRSISHPNSPNEQMTAYNKYLQSPEEKEANVGGLTALAASSDIGLKKLLQKAALLGLHKKDRNRLLRKILEINPDSRAAKEARAYQNRL